MNIANQITILPTVGFFFPAGALNVDVPDVFLFTTPSQQIYTLQRKGLWDE